MLELTDNQLHYVFGIPIGEHTILSEGVEPSDACVEFTRVAAGISDKGTHSLKASEEYLNCDITADSRKIDKDCFKIAFVIFVVGHALAPSAKHDYIKIDFWSALNDVTKIKEWNWCRYLLSHLFQAVRKFKSDVLRRPPTIHIVGYHLFLQVLVLDSLDLDVNSKLQGVYPRFALFDYDSMKKMVDAISVNMGEEKYLTTVPGKECRLKNEDDIDAENAPAPNNEGTVFLTPISNKINTRLEGIFANEGSYSGNSSNARKRNFVMGSSNAPESQKKIYAPESQKKICVSPNEPIQVRTPSGIDILNNSSISAKDGARNQVADIVYSFFDDLTACIVSHYAELRPSSNYITFRTTNDVVPNGIELHQQLAGIDELSHEVGAIIFRRFGQMDKFYNKDTATMIWRKFLGPDFVTAVLSNADPLTIQSIRTSFTDAVADLNPASSRLWHIPAILPDGWALYSFDMLKRRIVVLDPAVGPFGFSNRQVNMHTYVSDKLHSALLDVCKLCLRVGIAAAENGLGTTFLAWNFDGEKFQIPVTKDNLERHKNWLLYEVMRTDGNESMIPSDAIEAIKGSFLAL
ncbi:hypothetical protein D1007_25275 [Hordeum vulgare]|nr:hypothetical protein D1007_25275 [Hordeum vulgare]